MHVDLKSIPVRLEEAGGLLAGLASLVTAEIAQETNNHVLGLSPRQLGWAAVVIFSAVWLGRFLKAVADNWRKFDHSSVSVGLGSLGSAAQALTAGVAAAITQLSTAQFAGLNPQDYGKIAAFSVVLVMVGRIAQGISQLVGPVVTVMGDTPSLDAPLPDLVESTPEPDVSSESEDQGDIGNAGTFTPGNEGK